MLRNMGSMGEIREIHIVKSEVWGEIREARLPRIPEYAPDISEHASGASEYAPEHAFPGSTYFGVCSGACFSRKYGISCEPSTHFSKVNVEISKIIIYLSTIHTAKLFLATFITPMLSKYLMTEVTGCIYYPTMMK